MRRTDTEMLNYVLPLIGGEDTDQTFVERARNLTGALTAGLRGREAIEAAMGAIVLEKGEALPEPTALELIALECERVREVEGFSAKRDDEYVNGELARAAACYAIPEAHDHGRSFDIWPASWDRAFFKPTPDDRVRELVKAGQLIVAEIERLKRNPAKAEPSPGLFGEHQCGECQVMYSTAPDAEIVCPHCGARPEAVMPLALEDPDRMVAAGSQVVVSEDLRAWEGFQPQMESLIADGGFVTEISDGGSQALIADWWIPLQYVRVA